MRKNELEKAVDEVMGMLGFENELPDVGQTMYEIGVTLQNGINQYSKTKFADSIAVLRESLSADDSEGSYYHAWQANIAMAFKDEWQRRKDNIKEVSFTIDEVANQAAKNFLDMLCAKTQTPLDESEATPPPEEQSERSE